MKGMAMNQTSSSLATHGRQMQAEASALLTTIEAFTRDADAFLRQHATQRPYAVLAAAFGVGYIGGGGLATRLTSVAFGLGSRLAIALAARQLGERLPLNDTTEEVP